MSQDTDAASSMRDAVSAMIGVLHLSFVEILWTYASRPARPREVLWIVAVNAALGLLALIVSLGIRPTVLRAAWWLVWPAVAFFARSPQSPRFGLEPGFGPIRVGMLILSAALALAFARRCTASLSMFATTSYLIVQANALGYVFRGLYLRGLADGIQETPGPWIWFAVLACAGLAVTRLFGRTPERKRLVFGLGATATLGVIMVAGLASANPHVPFTRNPKPAAAAPSSPSVLLVVVDTLREDSFRLDAASSTPQLVDFARVSTRFERAYSTGTYSLPGHASLFTGLLPSEAGARPLRATSDGAYRRTDEQPIRAGLDTLAMRLASLGYDTAGISANPSYLNPWFGLSAGFHAYRADAPRPHAAQFQSLGVRVDERFRPGAFEGTWTAAEVTDAALDWLGHVEKKPFFLFLNYLDLHDWAELSDPRKEANSARLKTAYNAPLPFIDRAIGRLFSRMREQGLWNDTIVIVTSDHGEFLGEHGFYGHARSVPYEPVVRVPLLVKLNGAIEGSVESRLVTLADVFPMVARRLEGGAWSPQPNDQPRLVAESWWLRKGAASKEPPDGIPYSRTIHIDTFKLIEHWDGEDEIFDLASDPAESVNLLARNAQPKDLLPRIRAVYPPLRSLTASAAAGTKKEIPIETLERLRSLGYVK